MSGGAGVIRFLPLCLTLHDAALVGGGGDPVSPSTEHVIPGPTVRGLLNSACGSDSGLRARLVDSGRVQAAPGFPLVGDDGRLAYPAPLVLTTTESDRVEVVDPRVEIIGRSVDTVRGLVVDVGVTWQRAQVRSTTEQRLRRDRTRPGAEGSGPFTQTVLEADQRFVVHLRIVADDLGHAEELADNVLRALTAPGKGRLAVGAGRDSAFGGDVAVTAGMPGDARGAGLRRDPVPHNELLEDTPAGGEVDLVLRSPALVRDPSTGRPDPAALGAAVQETLDGVLGPGVATATATSTDRHLLGGAHALYHGPRPEHWAAAAGSAVRVRAERDIVAAQWRAVLAQRVGARPADGLGVLGLFAPSPRAELAARAVSPVTELPRFGHVRLPTGHEVPECPADAVLAQFTGPHPTELSRWQQAWLQDRMFRDTARDAVTDLADTLARAATHLPGAPVLGNLRRLAATAGDPCGGAWTPFPPELRALLPAQQRRTHDDPADRLAAVFDWLAATEREAGTEQPRESARRVVAELLDCALPGENLFAWLVGRVGPARSVPPVIAHALADSCLWEDEADDIVAAWLDRHGDAVQLLLVQAAIARLAALGRPDADDDSGDAR